MQSFRPECWERARANYSYDRQHLLNFIKQHQISGVIMINGDTHWGEISPVDDNLPYPLWEVISSGLTEEWKHVSPNQHRVGQATHQVNYGFIEIDGESPEPAIVIGLGDVKG